MLPTRFLRFQGRTSFLHSDLVLWPPFRGPFHYSKKRGELIRMAKCFLFWANPRPDQTTTSEFGEMRQLFVTELNGAT